MQVLRNDTEPEAGAPVTLTAVEETPPAGAGAVAIEAGNLDGKGDVDLIAVSTAGSIVPLAGGGPNDNVALLFNATKTISACPPDIVPAGGDGVVNIDDLFAIIAAWGGCAQPCPPLR